MKVFNAFESAEKEKDKDLKAYCEAKKELRKAYHELMYRRISEKEKIITDAAEGEKTDFLDVMGDVLDEKIPTLLSRMGMFKSYSMKQELEKQRREASKLGLN